MHVDTTIFMYAMGAESRFKESCARILRAGEGDRTVLVTSAETLQEVFHRYRSIGRSDEIKPTFEAIAASVQRILPVTADDVEEARQLGGRISGGRGVSARALVPRRSRSPSRPARDSHRRCRIRVHPGSLGGRPAGVD